MSPKRKRHDVRQTREGWGLRCSGKTSPAIGAENGNKHKDPSTRQDLLELSRVASPYVLREIDAFQGNVDEAAFADADVLALANDFAVAQDDRMRYWD